MTWKPKPLPYPEDVETKNVLRQMLAAHRALAELKGVAQSIPRQEILINTLALQEAKDSSAVENIVTTHDEMYKSTLEVENLLKPAAKEVRNYAYALHEGFKRVREKGIITANDIKAIQAELEKNKAGFRKLPGTTLKNQATGEVVYEPPQHRDEIDKLMANLEQYINNPALQEVDPLIKMAIIHFQFESIHPFYDGNGRTGRILNTLFLVKEGLLDLPILYLSRFIIQNKAGYYSGLQGVRDNNHWEEWLLYIGTGVEQTARHTITQIQELKALMQEVKFQLRDNYKFYSQDLLNHLFKHPYTKIEFLTSELNISRPTAGTYLNTLAQDGLLHKEKQGKTNYYINQPLMALLMK